MQPDCIIRQIDTLLDTLSATPQQKALARSLSIAGALSALLECTPAQLLRDLTPAFMAMQERDSAILRDATEGRR